jgi:hypothetical protein
MRFSVSIVPPGKWHYEQPLATGGSWTIRASGYERLIDAILTYRLNNLEIIPPGPVDRDVVLKDYEDWLCKSYPRHCFSENPPVQIRSTPIVPLITRINDHFKTLSIAGFTYVDELKAYERARTCIYCPQNVKWRSGCEPCNSNVQARAIRLIGVRQTPYDAKLQACRCYGHLNSIAVWIKEKVPLQSLHEVPTFCWRLAS